MITPAANNVKFYETTTDIGRMEPYAVLPHQELASIMERLVSWAAVIATHPEVAKIFEESSTIHIRLATDLRMAIKNAIQLGTYPNVVLSGSQFTTVITVSKMSQRLEEELHAILEKQMWE